MDAGVVAFQVPPEQSAQAGRQVLHRRIVEHRLPVLQVVDEDIPDRAADDVIPVDQLGWAQLSGAPECPDR